MRKRYSVEQITTILKQADRGTPVAELCRKMGISEQSFYRWKKVYGSLEPSEARELKQLKRREHKAAAPGCGLVARQGHAAGRALKKVLKPVRQREAVTYLTGRYQTSERRACQVTGSWRSSLRSRSVRDPLTGLRQRIRELAHARIRYGYRRLWVLLSREGWEVGRHRFYRVYLEQGLALRRKRPWRHVSAVHREQRQPAQARNDVWSMDFVAD